MNPANKLTLLRIILTPLIIAALLLAPVIPAYAPYAHWVAAMLFLIAAITDILDGNYARKHNLVTDFGKLMDPIADKLLVASTLLMMAAYDRLGYPGLWPAVIILCREVLVSGLREFLAEIKVGLPVTHLAKWKTGIQMVSIPMLMVADYSPWFCYFGEAGEVLIWIAAVLTVITGYDYLRAGLKHLD